ncbi:hypothetical protein [Halomonas korlensis]|uniref:hypothetical protein n=1 Tax=Halomonas korlensis TaxID=463301 RepID=UPI00111446DA|nr:hypothetical protein [Halomonas korlensis]
MLGDRYATLAGAEAWATFLFASHLLGHLDGAGKGRAVPLREGISGPNVMLVQEKTPRPRHARSD